VTRAFHEIVRSLARMSPLEHAGFCAGCAERALPAVEAVGSPGTVALVREGVELAWAAAGGDDVQVAEVADGLFRLPEARVDDSNSVEFLCLMGMSVVSDALEAVRAEASLPHSEDASEGVLNLLGGIDFVLSHAPGETRIVDARRPRPPGRLEAAELDVQRRSMQLLREQGTSALEAVRRLSRDRAQELERVLPQYVRRRFPAA
jgi:hypothetical protein